ncbi:hypothetical protein Anas_03339 [Armadillidium nasatum]|uniref:Uncharacterized protein n=1 Tax=Armadillidium nasatum TaxID=96803 RepID=A0A5N5T247_9CRUS|nr:hypothetical protein Anas_03339 [Armadillidium nasatum]
MSTKKIIFCHDDYTSRAFTNKSFKAPQVILTPHPTSHSNLPKIYFFWSLKVDEKQGSEKPPLGRPRSGTVGSCPPGAKRGTAGYHSEGYFSSDQDDDRPNKTDLKSPRSPRTPDTVQAQPLLVRSNSQDSSKGPSVRLGKFNCFKYPYVRKI